MKTNSLAALALALPLTIGSAWASSLSGATHDYGSGTGQIDPAGNDPVYAGHVLVQDWNSPHFSDTFDLSGLPYGSITSFTLTLDYANAAASGWNESWYVLPGNTSSLYSGLKLTSNARTTQSFVIDAATDTFTAMVKTGKFDFALVETSSGGHQFNLYSARLDVLETAPVPEPETYALFAAGLTLVGAIARRRARMSD